MALSGSGQQAKQQAPDIEVFINSLKLKWASQVENLKIEWEKMRNDAEAIRREVESRKTESFFKGSWDTLEKRHQLALLVYCESPEPLQKYLEEEQQAGVAKVANVKKNLLVSARWASLPLWAVPSRIVLLLPRARQSTLNSAS